MRGQNFVMHLGFWIQVAEVDTWEGSATTFYRLRNTKERGVSRMVSAENTLSVSGLGTVTVRQINLILWYINSSLVNPFGPELFFF